MTAPTENMVTQGIEVAGIRFRIKCSATVLTHLEPKLSGFYTDKRCDHFLQISQAGPAHTALLAHDIPHVSIQNNRIHIEHPGIFHTQFNLITKCGTIVFRHRPGDLDGKWPPRGPWMGLKTIYATLLLHNESGSMIHAGGVKLDEGSLIFLGQSGAGKSTITALLEEVFGPNVVLNDESIALTVVNHKLVAHSTPFSGLLDKKRYRNQAETKTLFNLIQSPDFKITTFPPTDALRLVMQCTVLPPGNATLESQALQMAFRLAQLGNWKSIHFGKDPHKIRAVLRTNLGVLGKPKESIVCNSEERFFQKLPLL